ncbi:MAG: hypothetical protein IJ333_08510 [Clostridia bacterium]|nr:hypothetical protein [Clostridia bacterium]
MVILNVVVPPIIIGAIILSFIGLFLYQRDVRKNGTKSQEQKPFKETEELPAEFIGARVLKKEAGIRYVGVKYSRHQQDFTIVFLTDRGEELPLPVPKEVFLRCEEQQTGTLVTVGGNFFSFDEGEEVWDPVADLPHSITVFVEGTGSHLQGIALDEKREYLYCSFTTCFMKMDLKGNPVASVKGLAGHLGCIAYNRQDGKIYGSLEFKHDQIGKDILEKIGYTGEIKDGFYIVAFDPEKMTRMEMDAEQDGVMTAVFLQEVYEDYTAEGHRYGCSGIDGVTFAPAMGEGDGKEYLYVAYGIYGDTTRTDNDYQVLLQYDITNWEQYAKPLLQAEMHRSGPEYPEAKYFVYTGNTRYGIQNLEYDAYTHSMLAAVYKGEKEQFANHSMFFIYCGEEPRLCNLKGIFEEGETLPLAEFSRGDSGMGGSDFLHGATGLIALGDGYYYISEGFKQEKGYGGHIRLYQLDAENVDFKEV